MLQKIFKNKLIKFRILFMNLKKKLNKIILTKIKKMILIIQMINLVYFQKMSLNWTINKKEIF